MTTEARLLRVREVLERVPVGRSKLYEMMREGAFPSPVKIGKVSAWRVSDVERWIAALEVAA